MADTHFSSLTRKIRTAYRVQPTNPQHGDFYFDNFLNALFVYNTNQWFYAQYSTTTSTSSSTTTTSTSTTTTSTSSSSSTSSSTSTTTSTTTTL